MFEDFIIKYIDGLKLIISLSWLNQLIYSHERGFRYCITMFIGFSACKRKLICAFILLVPYACSKFGFEKVR